MLPVNLHLRAMHMAREEVKDHIVIEEGEKHFNLFQFLHTLECRLYNLTDSDNSPCGRFELSAHALARYLWCCVALESGDSPDGNTFCGLPILD